MMKVLGVIVVLIAGIAIGGVTTGFTLVEDAKKQAVEFNAAKVAFDEDTAAKLETIKDSGFEETNRHFEAYMSILKDIYGPGRNFIAMDADFQQEYSKITHPDFDGSQVNERYETDLEYRRLIMGVIKYGKLLLAAGPSGRTMEDIVQNFQTRIYCFLNSLEPELLIDKSRGLGGHIQ